ncbi:uncharacterized protein LOC109194876 [Oreochromis niloticus]|uniref:uncharacterized protein LOC109194876 n=1 Tax=Oreochromis niloticus TaxID=8128 RepID=UPI000DF499C1|nr:uncharacterized protein LOC109194876 [Oreochromis niloticus]
MEDQDIAAAEQNNDSTGGESENTSETPPINERVAPDLTLVLIGDPASTEIGPKNIFLDHDEQTNVEQFSSNLYNLCGRHVCVINMLGLQTKEIPLNQGVHAFVLLLPNTLHSSQYSSGVEWLEKVFGRGALSYLITVVTHEPGETCESALKELKTNTEFNEKRFHTCNRSMMDENQVANLLEKINIMVSENDPQSYTGLVCAENRQQEGHLEDKSHEEERKDSDLKTNKRGTKDEDVSVNGKKESLKVSEVKKKSCQRQTEMLFGRLRLQDQLQYTFPPGEFLQICPPVKQHHVTSEKDLAHTFLHRLVIHNGDRVSSVDFQKNNKNLEVSKSQLMNTLINDRHNTFFHRNCPGSTKSQYLMDGVAEIACATY